MKTTTLLICVYFGLVKAELMEEYFNWRIRENPLMAYYLGYEQNTSSANDFSLEAIKDRYDMAVKFHERAKEDEFNRFNRMIKFETQTFMDSFHTKGFLLPPVTSKNGISLVIPQLFASSNALR